MRRVSFFFIIYPFILFDFLFYRLSKQNFQFHEVINITFLFLFLFEEELK